MKKPTKPRELSTRNWYLSSDENGLDCPGELKRVKRWIENAIAYAVLQKKKKKGAMR